MSARNGNAGRRAVHTRRPSTRAQPLVGVHVSTAGGLLEGLRRARELALPTLQLFTSSPRQWAPRQLLDKEAERFRAARRAAGVGPAFAHDSYLVRLGHCDEGLLRKSLAAFLAELERSRALGLDAVVTHPAAFPGCDPAEALLRIAESLNQIAARQRGRGWPRILLENTAGHGMGLLHRFEEIARLLEMLEPKERFGVCLDTCHAFAAGYELRTPAAYRRTWRAFDASIGLERLTLIHANDSKMGLGSRRDRHAHIGEGQLGLRAFRLLMRDPALARVPKVIETPKRRDGIEMDPINVNALRRLAATRRRRRGGSFAGRAGALVLAGLLGATAPDAAGAEAAPCAARPVLGQEVALDSARGRVPLSGAAREWIREHRELIGETARRFGIPALALAGVVAAERTLLHDSYDDIVDGLFRAYFATLSEEALASWVSAQELAYRQAVERGGEPGLGRLKNPYLWSVGPAQVSFRNVVFYEPRLARLTGRDQRTLREIVAAILSPAGSLEYAAVILLEAEEAYARYAGLDLRSRPGVLATLYHLGSPARRALRLGEENRRRELQGEAPALPQLNFYGEFVEENAAELGSLLR